MSVRPGLFDQEAHKGGGLRTNAGLCTDAPLNPQDHLTGSLLMIKEEADSFLELEDFPEVLKPPILELVRQLWLDNTIASYKEMKASNPEYFNKFEEALFKLSEEERAEDPRLVALKEKNEAFEDPNDVAYQAMESQYDTEYVMEKLTAAGLNEYPLSAADKADYA
ncbi:MAG: hypothetical protein SGPRY_007884, partial [Prymnesium sp.]